MNLEARFQTSITSGIRRKLLKKQVIRSIRIKIEVLTFLFV